MTTLGQNEDLARFLSLGLIAGIWLILGGVVGLYRSVADGMAAVWMRIGFYLSVVTASVWTVTFGLLIAQVDAANQWMLASSADAATSLSTAEALYLAFASLYTIAIIAESVAFVIVGLALGLSPIYGRWIGSVGSGLGMITLLAVGIPRAVDGPSQTNQLIFFGVSLLSLLWLFFLGIWLLTQHVYDDQQD